MLRTPANFTSLLVARRHPEPVNLVFRGDALLVRESDLALPDAEALSPLNLPDASWHPVGMLADRFCQTAWTTLDTTIGAGFAFRRLRSLFGSFDDNLLAVAGRAYQITEWARTHRYCGACGSPTVLVEGERCLRCPNCAHAAYPRISPAMMVLIKHQDSILLARHTNSPTRYFTALAGFLEAGESIEDAIHREVYEEVGLVVTNLQYFGSQPWPFPHSLMLAFTADYVSGDMRVDETEIAEAAWFGPSDPMPLVPPIGLSIAGQLIAAHLPRRSAKHPPA
jgi:NAD+ diphosphatase